MLTVREGMEGPLAELVGTPAGDHNNIMGFFLFFFLFDKKM